MRGKRKQMLLVLLSTGIVTAFSAFLVPDQEDELNKSMERGKQLYMTNCANCHMPNGEGISGVFPPLANTEYLMADLERSIQQILYGVSGEMTVNGVSYNGAMNGYNLSDQETADLLNYIRNSWGNEGRIVTAAMVNAQRKQ